MKRSVSISVAFALAILVAKSAFAQPAPAAPSSAPVAPPAASAPAAPAPAAPSAPSLPPPSAAPSAAGAPSLPPPSAPPPELPPATRVDREGSIAEPVAPAPPARTRGRVALPPAERAPIVIAAPAPDAPDDAPKPLKKYVQRKIEVAAGVRTVLVRGAGFDPYASTDVLPGPSIGVRATVLDLRPFSVSLLGGYDPSFVGATARGDDTHLVSHRISVGIEGRVALGHRVALFGRATPGILNVHGTISDPGVPDLVANAWTWSLDATGGLALLVGRVGDPDWPAVQFWLTGELGYAFAGEVAMAFVPDAPSDDPRRYGGVDLPALALSGMTDRFTFAVSF